MTMLLAVFRLLFLGIVMIVSAALWSVVAILLLPWRYYRIRWGDFYGHVVGYLVTYWIAGATVEIDHPERLDSSRPAIYVMNHTSNLDVYLGVHLHPSKACGVAKRELLAIPILGQIWWLSGHLLIDRKNRERAIASMEYLAGLVKKWGLGIWIYPEGTRSKDGRLIKFKKGFVHLALSTGLPVVPVVASGVHNVWPARGWQMKPGKITVKVLDPIDTSDWTAENIDEIIESVEQKFIDVLPEDQKPLEPLG